MKKKTPREQLRHGVLNKNKTISQMFWCKHNPSEKIVEKYRFSKEIKWLTI